MRTIIVASCFLLTACGGPGYLAPPVEQKEKVAPVVQGEPIEETAIAALEALMERDVSLLADYVHPQTGVRFTPYTTIDTEHDRVLDTESLLSFFQDEEVYTWGNRDGTGEPIELTNTAYFEEFVADQDYRTAPTVTWNERMERGNGVDNTAVLYPHSQVVELHFPGFNEEYDGLDWVSLRLVFVEHGHYWYLVNIIHDGWTI